VTDSRGAVRDAHMLLIDESVVLDRALLGGKALSLARMTALGLPVPPACVLPTTLCDAYHGAGGEQAVEAALTALRDGIAWIEGRLDRTFGAGPRPLLVSVRSGAPNSMPGMMDTILNLGIDDSVERALAEEAGDAGWAAGLHDRLRHQLAEAVDGRPEDAPSDPWDQLALAVRSVLRSWHSPRAIAYRAHHGIAETPGTAVTVQAMVFGNLDADSGTGVAFSRNPIDGAPGLYGEWLPRAQGEDLVSGARTPEPLRHLHDHAPALFAELAEGAALLERTGADMQDIEFTVQRGRLYLLQSRAGKRSSEAALQIAVDLAREAVITPDEVLARVTPQMVRDVAGRAGGVAAGEVLATGEPASPGLATGVVVMDADEAERRADDGEAVILARPTTNPADVHGMIAAEAVITEVGGATSHAALVTRDLGKPCVVGCGRDTLGALEGRVVTVDGTGGRVLAGEVGAGGEAAAADDWSATLVRWAQAAVPMEVRQAAPGEPADDDSDEGLRAALAAGAASIAVAERLPALLTLAALVRDQAQRADP
jgi:pyruvate,orthophosphate dikinase